MKTLAAISALLAACALSLSLHAQDYAPAPVQAPPPPDNGNYDVPQDQAPPPPDQQSGPDQGTGPDQGAPDQGTSFQTFYDNLGQQGTWIQSSDYGYVWQPNVSDSDWAPYTDGHWVYTDAGWTWVSDEPWGWATYHYGRWVNLDGTGWCWVPGYTWAPAWVSWRYGDGYCGWAPLPPESFVGIDYIGDGIQITAGFHIGGDCDSYYGIGAGCYHFLPATCIGYSNYHRYYANRYNNYAIINRTTNVTNVYVNHRGEGGGHRGFGHVTTGGPSFAQVNAVSQTPVQHVRLARTSQPGGGGHVANNSLALFAPNVAPGAAGQPTHLGGSLGRATVNRGADVTRPLAVNRTVSAPAPTQSQIQAAQVAQFSAPPHAKVVTPSTQVSPILQTPLTTMKPITNPSVANLQGGAAGAPVNHFNQQPHAGGNTVPNAQGNSLAPITQPAQGASANNSVVHPQSPVVAQPEVSAPSTVVHPNANSGSHNNPYYQHQQAAPSADVYQNENSAPQNNPFFRHQQAAPSANVQQNENSAPQTNPYYQHRQAAPSANVQQNENSAPQNNPFFQHQQTAPAAVAAPIHAQAPPPQPPAAPVVIHHNENNNSQQNNQPVQQQSQPAPSSQSQGNQQSQGYPSGQGGNGGHHHQQDH